MAQSSILGGSAAPMKPSGTGTDLLGPSDSSDSGSDVQGERRLSTDVDGGGAGATPVDLDSDSDAGGTGERGSAVPDNERDDGDILPDRVIDTSSDALDGAVSIDDPLAVGVDELIADEDDQPDADEPSEAVIAERRFR